MKKSFIIGLFLLLTANMAFAGWVTTIKATGENIQDAVFESDCIIGVDAQEEKMDAVIFDPPKYTVSLKMYDSNWNDPYYKYVQVQGSDEYLWYLILDPKGNVVPPIARTAVLSWDKTTLDPNGTYQLQDLSGNVLVEDMINIPEYSVTSANTQTFAIIYKPGGFQPNQPPEIAPVEDIEVNEEAASMTVNINVSDPDGDSVEITVKQNSNETLLTVTQPTQGKLNLNFLKDQSGIANIIIKASDGKAETSTGFTVTVNPVDDPPYVKNTIDDVSAVKSDGYTTITLTNVFSDIDNDDTQIVKTAVSKNSALVQASVSGDILRLDFQGEQTGITTIDVTGTSNGKTFQTSFSVNVTSGESIKIELPDIRGISGASVSVPITLTNPDSDNINSADLTIKADPNVITYVGATLAGGILAGNYSLKDNVVSDEIILSIRFDDNAVIKSSGPIVSLEFQLIGDPCDTTDLIFTEAVFNEEGVNAINAAVKIICGVSCRDGSLSTDEDQAISGDLSELITNPDNLDLSFSFEMPENGYLGFSSDSSVFLYTPHTGFNGSDSFVYTISDGSYEDVTGTVFLTVRSVIDAQINLTDGHCASGYPGNFLRIPVHIVADESVSECRFSVDFNPEYFSASDIQISNAYNFTASMEKHNDHVDVTLNAESPAVLTQTIAELIFAIASDTPAGLTGTMIVSENPTVNGVTAQGNNGCFEIFGEILTGRVAYYKDDKPVPDVVISAVSGSRTYTTLSFENGTYTMYGLQPGTYTISASKQDNSDNGISPMDASIICQYRLKIQPLNCFEMVAADTSQNGRVYSMDASQIIFYLLSMKSSLDGNHWTFLDPNTSIEGCDGDSKIAYTSTQQVNIVANHPNTPVNFTAIRLGDVTGNYDAAPVMKRKRKSVRPSHIPVTEGETLSIPIQMNDWISLSGLNLTISYDPSMLEPKKADFGDGELKHHHDYSIFTNTRTPGKLQVIAFARSNLATVSGNVLDLNFKVITSGRAYISIVDFSCNESECNGGFNLNDMNTFLIK
ncbi:peptidase-like protein [Candidatus Magnetomorum sp. HK-1]|nr:peptidase-like protein [Candidatus Magnetomorum sp. HK-1]